MQLVNIDAISPSTYNPREADPERLKYIEYSLKKLGFLLPLYVCKKTGEILSGHQRHYVSKQIGLKKVPVQFVKPMSLERRKAYNIAFNRGTNDLKRDETSETVNAKIKSYDLNKLLKETPDVVDFYPCLKTVKINGKKLASVNIKNNNKYSKNLARTISKVAGYMPVVITKDLKVVNGIGRLFHQLEKGIKDIECVIVPDDRAELAHVMLNLVSMDFNLHKKYEDDLRYNSFRRAVTNRKGGLGKGFLVGAFGDKRGIDYKELKGSAFNTWVNKYGDDVVDFGAGRFTDTNILRSAGINVYPFEPFMCNKDDVDRIKSVENTKEFLKVVASGKKFSSIFVSSVFNSVPFFEDRLHITTICAALCSKNTIFTVWTMNEASATLRNIYSDNLSEKFANSNQFMLDYEENIVLGSFQDKPKVQKFHTKKELIDLLKNNFENIKIARYADSYLVEARNAKVNVERLRLALEFEFNLPYPDGQRMNLVDEAKEAFSKRLGVEL